MDIIISNAAGQPIYEQICRQIKGAIASGALKSGEPLPSIRALARDLRISVITTKRAYEDLERAGFVHTQPGKGSFVAPQDPALHREETLREVERHLQRALDAARAGGVPEREVAETLSLLMEGDRHGKSD